MKHFPARTYPAQIAADEITRSAHAMFWTSVLQCALCGVVGLIAGIALGLGYLADLPDWLQ